MFKTGCVILSLAVFKGRQRHNAHGACVAKAGPVNLTRHVLLYNPFESARYGALWVRWVFMALEYR